MKNANDIYRNSVRYFEGHQISSERDVIEVNVMARLKSMVYAATDYVHDVNKALRLEPGFYHYRVFLIHPGERLENLVPSSDRSTLEISIGAADDKVDMLPYYIELFERHAQEAGLKEEDPRAVVFALHEDRFRRVLWLAGIESVSLERYLEMEKEKATRGWP